MPIALQYAQLDERTEFVSLPVLEGTDGLVLLDLRNLPPPAVRIPLSFAPFLSDPPSFTALELLSPGGFVRSAEGLVIYAKALNREVAPGEAITNIVYGEM